MHSVNLSQAARMWPTPVRSDYQQRRKSENWAGSDLVSTVTEAEEVAGNIQPQSGGQLNPDWVEWLMNWPVQWSSLNRLPDENFNEWLARTKGGATQISPDSLRELRKDGWPSPAPQRPEQEQQHAGEHRDPLSALSCSGAREGWGLGSGECETTPVCDMRNGVSVQPNPEGEGMQPEVSSEVGRDSSGEKMGEKEQGSNVSLLRDRVSIHAAEADELQRNVREQDGMAASPWWSSEPMNVPRVATGIPKRADRLKAIGNGQVPAALVLAWHTLIQRIENQ